MMDTQQSIHDASFMSLSRSRLLFEDTPVVCPRSRRLWLNEHELCRFLNMFRIVIFCLSAFVEHFFNSAEEWQPSGLGDSSVQRMVVWPYFGRVVSLSAGSLQFRLRLTEMGCHFYKFTSRIAR